MKDELFQWDQRVLYFPGTPVREEIKRKEYGDAFLHSHDKFPKTNGWEFFFLEVSKEGTKIADRGDSVVNVSQGVTCLSCHQPAARFDFVCEKGHGCAPIPFDDQKIAAIQKADPRCTQN